MKKLLLLAAGSAALLSVTPAMAQTAIDFEGNILGTAVDSTYGAQGITFSGAEFKECNGGCPVPVLGAFISSVDFASPFTATFNGTASNFSFANVSFSNGSADAFSSGGTLLETINFAAFPGTFTFSAANIASVRFGSTGQFGVDDFAFTLAGAVPEPGTWAMMIVGFGAVGGAMRRRATVRTAVRFA